jgi:hypothetical protein
VRAAKRQTPNHTPSLFAVALAEHLESKDAQGQVITLPAGQGGAKVGLDDYFSGKQR